jgi:hypothetical protein
MLSFTDAAPGPTGRLHIEVFRKGVLVEVFDEDNLVVDGYKNTHSHLIGGDTTNYRVTQFGVGTNGTAPAAGNTALTSPFTKAVDSVSYPASGQVQFGFSLASGEANGKSIMEFGLLTAGGVLYARRVRASALVKTSDISFTGTWTITF